MRYELISFKGRVILYVQDESGKWLPVDSDWWKNRNRLIDLKTELESKQADQE